MTSGSLRATLESSLAAPNAAAAITALWHRHWAHVIPFFAYPQEVRKMIYTTNAIESLNAKLRRSVRIRGHFPNDEAAMKLIWLQLREITKNWKMPAREWHAAKAQFALLFGDRFEMNHTHIRPPSHRIHDTPACTLRRIDRHIPQSSDRPFVKLGSREVLSDGPRY